MTSLCCILDEGKAVGWRLLRLKLHLYYVAEITERKHVLAGGNILSVMVIDQEHTIAYIPREKGRPEVVPVTRRACGSKKPERDTQGSLLRLQGSHFSIHTRVSSGMAFISFCHLQIGAKPTSVLAKKQAPSMPPKGQQPIAGLTDLELLR